MPARRCFVALLPDVPARAALDRLARTLQRAHAGSRRVLRANLHLTLAFIGALDPARATQVVAALRRLRLVPFTWTIDHCGGFEHGRVLWADGSDGKARVLALAEEVRQMLAELGIAFDTKAFRPHVTLLRHVAGVAVQQACEPIVWRAGTPVLMESARDARGALRYRPWSVPNTPRARID